jgi:Zn-dependent peptidase ImmA (M78 family)/transcriptional regulator with XRE-family HTH domain
MQKGSKEAVSVKIKAYRQLLRLSQSFVGEKVLGVDRTVYSRMENGKIKFSTDDLRNLANLFRVSMEDFFTLNDSLSTGNRGQKHWDEFLLVGEFHHQNETAFTSIKNGARDLVLFAGDPASRKYVLQRQKKARDSSARFRNVADALRYCKSRRSGFLAGSSLLIDKFIIEEFGLWISWNPLGPFSCVFLEQGKAVTANLRLPLPLISLNSEHSLERQRLSAAHGLAHHLLGRKGKTGCFSVIGKDPAEKEAERFARNLLMDPETVLKQFDLLRGSGEEKELLNASLMTAYRLQVSYPELVKQLASLSAIDVNEKEELLRFKNRDLKKMTANGRFLEPFKDAYIQHDEKHLGKKNIYQTDANCGGPKGPQDLRYLQESSYVEYLRFCKTKAPVELSVVFEHVADFVRKKYPKYL